MNLYWMKAVSYTHLDVYKRQDKENGWTISTQDHKLSAQWENMVLITEKGYEILTK